MKAHLHVVVATSPAGDAFRQRCRTHPSLVNCCTLDWYDDWSDKAMLRVAHVYLGQVDFSGIVGIQDPVVSAWHTDFFSFSYCSFLLISNSDGLIQVKTRQIWNLP